MLKIEKQLWESGYTNVVGLDEAGRGPWAGPLVVGAVILPPKISKKSLQGIKDSKKLSPLQLKKYFKKITRLACSYAVGIVEHDEIDFWGLGKSVQLGLLRALNNLSGEIEYLLLDANMWKTRQIPMLSSDFQNLMKKFYALPYQTFIRGEDISVSIAAASIIAKVTRDSLMEQYDQKFPQYRFSEHKGYGTKVHQELLKKFGCCEIHRKSFKPVQIIG